MGTFWIQAFLFAQLVLWWCFYAIRQGGQTQTPLDEDRFDTLVKIAAAAAVVSIMVPLAWVYTWWCVGR